MELLEKLAAMKKKVGELEVKSTSLERDFSNQLKSIKGEMSIMRDLTVKLDKVSLKSANDSESFSEQLKALDIQVNKKLSDMDTGKEKIAKLSKEVDSQLSEFQSKIKDIISFMGDAEKKKSESFSKESKRIAELESTIEKIKKDFEKSEKEMKKILFDTPTDRDLKDVHSDISKINKELSGKVSDKDVEKIKKATKQIDEIVADSLKDMRFEFEGIKAKMKEMVELKNLHKHFAELKMDVTSTEAGLKRQIDEIQQTIGMIKQDTGRYPDFNVLAQQDQALKKHVESLDKRFDVDFKAVLEELEKLGSVFAKRSEVEMNAAEVRTVLDKTTQMMKELDRKHIELEKQIVIREDTKDRDVANKVEDVYSQAQYMFDNFNENRETMQRIDEEFKILKEQVILTQNAIMELNSFIQQRFKQ